MYSREDSFTQLETFGSSAKLESEPCRMAQSDVHVTPTRPGCSARDRRYLGEPVDRINPLFLGTEVSAEVVPGRGCVSPSTSVQKNVDVFGNRHPAVAVDLIDCFHCARSVAAGRFAPHLHKCMGKGRQASRQASKAWLSTIRQKSKDKKVDAAGTSVSRGRQGTDYESLPSSSKSMSSRAKVRNAGKSRQSKARGAREQRSSREGSEVVDAKTFPVEVLPDNEKISPRIGAATCALAPSGGEISLDASNHGNLGGLGGLDCPAGRTRSREARESAGVHPRDIAQQPHSGCLTEDDDGVKHDPRLAEPNSSIDLSLLPRSAKSLTIAPIKIDDILSGGIEGDACVIKVTREASSPPLSDTSTMTAETFRESPSPHSRDEQVEDDCVVAKNSVQNEADEGLLLLDCLPVGGSCLPATVPTRKRCGRLAACMPNFLRRVKTKH